MSYISRFIWWAGCLSVLLLAGGCRKHTLAGNAEEDYALVDAMLILRCSELETRTQTESEQQVNDLNLFFVHKSYPSPAAPEVRHYYFTSSDIDKHLLMLRNIRLGPYRMYAVANVGKSLCSGSHELKEPDAVGDALCSMTEADIKDLAVECEEPDLTRADNLPMSFVDEDMQVKRGDGGTVPAITITLARKVAKFSFTYNLVGKAVGKMKIKSVGMRYVPNTIALFAKNEPTSAGDFHKVDGVNPLCEFGEDGFGGNITNENPVIFYLPENMQGDVKEITSEKDRNGQKAPRYASYIFIDSEFEEEDGQKNQYGFSIYLGDNVTDNFDVQGNAYYQVHLELGGPDPDDIRISSLKINVETPFPISFKLNEPQEAVVEIICSNYFNDELQLVCSAPGALGESFEVSKVGGDGNPFDDVSGIGKFWYNVLVTDDQPGERSVKCKVVYLQTMEASPIQMNLMLRSRYGTATVVDRKSITVRK